MIYKHTIGDDALKVIKTFSYTEAKGSDNWHVVMDKLEKYCIGEVNQIIRGIALTSKINFQPSWWIVSSLN